MMQMPPDLVAALGPPLALVVWLLVSARRTPDAPPMSQELAAIREELSKVRESLTDARERLARLEGVSAKN